MSAKKAKKAEEIRRSAGFLDEAEAMGTPQGKNRLKRKPKPDDEDIDLGSIP